MPKSWDALLPRLRELTDLEQALRLLHWDQAVMMPRRGAAGRARAVATLEAIAHDRLTDPALGDLLEELSSEGSLDDVQRASVRVLRRDYEQATKVPRDLVAAMAEARGLAYQAWTEARPASDYSIAATHLSRLIALKRQEADALGWEDERYDALLDLWEPGLRTKDVSGMFSELKAGLKPIVEAVTARAGEAPEFVKASFAEGSQMAFCEWLVEHVGFEPSGGRLDRSPHPFTTRIGAGDVRQTTRTEAREVLWSIYAALHETGHALYEQGLPDAMRDLPAGRPPSLGMHESQSRLWENQVGRSRAFSGWLLLRLKERFPSEMGMVTPEHFYRAVNRVTRSLVRVTADELTYNLHIAHRFELERALFRDELEVENLPEAWTDQMDELLGLRPDSDSVGVLQDMHWWIGAIGYFPTYTIGNLYAAALYERASADLQGLEDDLQAGECSRLLEWLRTTVHARAYLRTAPELVVEICGERPGSGPLLRYLGSKYSEL